MRHQLCPKSMIHLYIAMSPLRKAHIACDLKTCHSHTYKGRLQLLLALLIITQLACDLYQEQERQVMGEVVPTDELSFDLATTPTNTPQPLKVITIAASSTKDQVTSITSINGCFDGSCHLVEPNPREAWLPITESRNGNIYSSIFHLLNSGIGFQALLLPVAFATLGWAWGTICLCLAFVWQLYTIWILVQLHESVTGTRYSRYLQLSIAAFGPKLGKLLAIFPVMYLSGGTCVMLIITGGGTMEQFYKAMCDGDLTCEAKSLSGTEWFLVFICIAIVIAQFPNLNSIAKVSLIGAITGIVYFTLLWVLSIRKGRLAGVSYHPSEAAKSDMARFGGILNAIGIIVLSFRGHNVVLEIQGTLPSSQKHPSKKPMWRGVTISYMIIAMCLFPVAIGGFWAYGNKVPQNGGMCKAFWQIHGHNTSKFAMGVIYLLVVINSLSSFQIYAMPVFDNLEFRYTIIKNKRCSIWVRTGFRLFFGGLTFLIAVTFPFLGSLASLLGGLTLNLAYTCPCFMWISIKKPRQNGTMWCLNLGLGLSGMVLSVMLVVGALWNLVDKGLNANFFKP